VARLGGGSLLVACRAGRALIRLGARRAVAGLGARRAVARDHGLGQRRGRPVAVRAGRARDRVAVVGHREVAAPGSRAVVARLGGGSLLVACRAGRALNRLGARRAVAGRGARRGRQGSRGSFVISVHHGQALPILVAGSAAFLALAAVRLGGHHG